MNHEQNAIERGIEGQYLVKAEMRDVALVY